MINIFQLNKQIIYLSLITIKSELNFISFIKILLTRSFFIKSSMNTNMIPQVSAIQKIHDQI